MVGKLTPDTFMSCSRLPALLGFSPYSSPNNELQKTLDALDGKGREPLTGDSAEAADWGNTLEATILAKVVERLGIENWEAPTIAFAGPPEVALNASLDGIAYPAEPIEIRTDEDKGIYVIGSESIVLKGPGVLESKLTAVRPEDSPAPHRGPIQVQGALLCTGFEWAAIGVLYQGTKLRIFVYKRDEEMIDRIIEAVADFERRKAGPDWYNPVSSSDAAATWARGEADAPPVALPVEAFELVDEIVSAKAVIKTSQKIIDECQAAIMAMMGNHTDAFVTAEDGERYEIRWPMRNYKAKPAKTTPAKAAYSIRMKTIQIVGVDADDADV